jgi:uncharacterized membrane protein
VITLELLYLLMGALTGGVALVTLLDRGAPRRLRSAAFWGLYAITFLLGSRLPSALTGGIVVVMALLAGVGGLAPAPTTTDAERAARVEGARRWGNRLFVPALLIPAVTLGGAWLLRRLSTGPRPLADPKQVTLVALGLATLAALGTAMLMLRARPAEPLRESRRLLDAIGWAAVLPQLLAALGALFALAGVGRVVSELAARWLPLGTPFAAVAAYAVGMALFTMVMGNAFAAFPVMTAGIGLPLVVHRFGGDPAVVAAIGMLSGFCGTLLTPMAANFNIVPVALLELPDEYAVIRAQIPTALVLLVANVGLMWWLAFR